MLTTTTHESRQFSVSHLRNILEAFRRGGRVPATPLKQLVPRHFRPSWWDFPDERMRSLAADAALIEWLSSEITKGLGRQRRCHGLKPPKRPLPRSKAVQALRLDFQIGDEELEAWSVLFYQYVRVDLNLSQEEWDAIIAFDVRTLRRRRELGLRRLSYQLARHAVYDGFE